MTKSYHEQIEEQERKSHELAEKNRQCPVIEIDGVNVYRYLKEVKQPKPITINKGLAEKAIRYYNRQDYPTNPTERRKIMADRIVNIEKNKGE